jgi:hypothetical protein
MGGLGNQLFQIITILAYSIRYNRHVVFTYDTVLKNGIHRPTYWDTLFNNIKDRTTHNINLCLTNEQVSSYQRYTHNDTLYNEIPLFPKENIMMYGYFQSYKYFHNEIDKIFEILNIDIKQGIVASEYADLLEGQTISMHFRLGDYVHQQQNHPVLPATYYQKAVSYILSKRSGPLNILYFCEATDNDAVNKTLDTLRDMNIRLIKAPDTIPDWKQMLLMSLCKDNIIANSTFSWWGSYFNRKKDAIHCYPNLWFGPAISWNLSGLFPDSWVKINV